MVLTVEDGKAARRAGVAAMTAIAKIHRDLTGGRPPVIELRTPLAAVTAARTLYRELEARMTGEGHPSPGGWAVSVGYISPDLTLPGFTPLYAKETEGRILRHLDGQVPLGLVFGLVDGDAIITGSRPFIPAKQVEEWLRELHTPVRLEMRDR